MIRVRLTLEADGATCLESPYDRSFVDGLKAAIDYGGRSWDPSRKKWLISALYAEELCEFLQQVGAQVQDDRWPVGVLMPPPAMPEDLRQAFETLHLAYTAPLGVAEAVYRFWAKQTHTDVGGTVEHFHLVNDAIQVIRKHLDPKSDDDIPF